MKNLCRYPILLAIAIMSAFFAVESKAELPIDSEVHAFENDSFKNVMNIMHEYEYGEKENFVTGLDHAFEDHEKLTNFTKNYGLFLKDQIKKQIPLTGTQINLIQFSLSKFLKLTSLIDLKLDRKLEELKHTTLNLETLSTALHQMISISERYKFIHSLFFNEGKLRRIIQSQTNYHPYNLYEMENITDKILSQSQEKKIRKFLSLLHERTVEGSAHRKRLDSTLSYQLYTQQRSLSPIYSKDIYWSDIFSNAITQVSRGLSWSYGMSVGEVEWGPGKLYQNQKLIDQMQDDLRPLDLVFEKKKYKLTDYTIPGHWGHVGIWLGSKEQLVELGLWEHSSLDPFRDQIEAGNSIYEVRKWGLNFESLEGFSNLDEVAITRLTSLKEKPVSQIASIYKNLAEQMDKSYDFTFNILATDRTTCTEIIYLSYGHINWPSEVILGRRTISPNNMAELIFYDSSPMELIRYIGSDHQGRVIEKSKTKFAQTVDFFPKRYGVNQVRYQKKKTSCRRVRRRIGSGIRFHNECDDDYVTKKYSESPVFDFKIEF